MITVLLLVFASGVVLWLLVFAYQGSTAMVGRRRGIIVEEVKIGMGPSLWIWQSQGQVWRFKALPFAGNTLFRGMGHNEEKTESLEALAGSFKAAPLASRFLVMVTGPLTILLIGVLLLGLAVMLGGNQLVTVSGERPEQAPGLAHDMRPSTWGGQLQLAEDTAGRYFTRLLSFRTLEGWGGWMAFLVTAGRVGAASAMDWVTLMGLTGLTMGCINLLPIPALNGFAILELGVTAALRRSHLPARIVLPLTHLGVCLILVLWARVLWLDVCWVWENG